jgi:pimeloyl-ACP methyl ester carboxylesterase
VLLHGILCDSRVWRQLDDLRHEFIVVAWDALETFDRAIRTFAAATS